MFLGSVPRRRQLAFLGTLRGDFLATIEELEETARTQPAQEDPGDENFFRTATIDLGLRIARARLDWVDAVIAQIGLPEASSATTPPRLALARRRRDA